MDGALLGLVARAAGMFAVTNVDDILVLALFFGRCAGQRGASGRVVIGQYLGFAAILVASVAGALGAGLLPRPAIAYLGLLPLLLGIRAGWGAWRDRRDTGPESGAAAAGRDAGGPGDGSDAAGSDAGGSDAGGSAAAGRDAGGPGDGSVATVPGVDTGGRGVAATRGGGPSVGTVAAVTFANGGDNIGVYVPVFATAGRGGLVGYTVVFLALVGVWCAVGRFLATRPPVARALARFGHLLLPAVLIGIGLLILVEGRAFGL